MQLIVAEKPSVARDIARVLGVRGQGHGSLESRERVVTWCVGHLVELDEPASYDSRWKAWRMESLPMLPERFKLRPTATARDQFNVVQRLLTDKRFTEVINACDAGREGELIFRYVFELAGCKLPIRRLWISSMTDEAVSAGFANLRPGVDYEPLADAARCRSEADWLVGLNATRAVTVRHRDGSGKSPLYSIGRVQTPTLAILVERERAVTKFVARDYWELLGTFRVGGEKEGSKFTAPWSFEGRRRLATAALADALAARTRSATPSGGVVEKLKQKRITESPPPLFDLTTLQRTANRRFGFSAERTLQLAQALYERHKVLTYPRTDARYLPMDMKASMPSLFKSLGAINEYATFALPLLKTPPNPGKRVFDDSKVSDHHAIIPTGKAAREGGLDKDESRIFDLVARRFLGVFYPDAIFAVTEAVVRVGEGGAPPRVVKTISEAKRFDSSDIEPEQESFAALPSAPDRFVARGRIRVEAGWQTVAGFGDGKEGGDDAADLPLMKEGDRLRAAFEPQAKKTRPPPRHNEASLLAAMETAGREIEDESLRAAMKDSGLGTPATRASIIETLIHRDFIRRDKKVLQATDTGMALIEALPVASLASPELTGSWEARLTRIARGLETRVAFMKDIRAFVEESVGAIRGAPRNRVMAGARPTVEPTLPVAAKRAPQSARNKEPSGELKAPKFKVDDLVCPACKQGHLIAGKRGWGCERWKEGCKFVVWFDVGGVPVQRKADLKKRIAEYGK
ncbi:MAG: DNA topoisomerase [Deltaproteobacteria bacterium]|nr:DNA topoisomerase [Deltaproteobacteria bacterium]